jgi:protein gp37
MGKNSAINWTDHTANWWTGCVKVSAGCEHCYAEALAKRFGKHVWGPAKTTPRLRGKAIWKDILKWDAEAAKEGIRRRVFVSSMSDFLEDHPMVAEWREQAKAIIRNLKNLDVLILTKRPENAERFLADWYEDFPQHVWMGTTVENQATADKRMANFANIPASIHFLSVEPMLEKIDLKPWISPRSFSDINDLGRRGQEAAKEIFACNERTITLPSGELYTGSFLEPFKVDWIICGGESGPKARPFSWDWARQLRDDCKLGGIAFWMKQGGGMRPPHELEDIPEDLRIRELPNGE